MAKLGVEKYNSALSVHLKALLEADYISFLDATPYGIGYIYYLKKKGALALSRNMEISIDEISFCNNTPKPGIQTLFHRTNAIDCHIEVYKCCQSRNIKLLFYDREFETLGNMKRDNNLTRKTRLYLGQNVILEPDAIFMIQTSNSNKLYCLEYEHRDFTKKSIQKALKHVQALNLKAPSQKYSHPKAHRVLFIYHNVSTMNAVMDYLNNNVSSINSWFLFKTYEETVEQGKFIKSRFISLEKKNFFKGWLQANGERVSLY